MAITTQQLVTGAAEGIRIIGNIASIEEKVMPWAMMIGGLVPGVATVLGAIAIAQPYIDQVAAHAPEIADLVQNRGVPVVDAIKRVAPPVLDHLKNAYAALAKADPTLRHVTAADVTDAIAGEMFRSMMAASYFTPQDPRFDRVDSAHVGG